MEFHHMQSLKISGNTTCLKYGSIAEHFVYMPLYFFKNVVDNLCLIKNVFLCYF